MKSIFITLLVLSLTGCVTYPLPDATLKPVEVCGKSKCSPGNLGFPLQFKKDPYSPDLSQSIQPIDIAFSVLGHTTRTDDESGARVTVCAADGISNPFSRSDVVPKNSTSGRTIDYSKDYTLDIDIVPTVSATLAELQKQIDVSAYLTELEAKLTAGYKSIDKSKSTLNGVYYEWGLSELVIKTLHTAKYAECTSYLKDKEKSLITAVGFIKFTTSVDSSDYSKFIGELNAVFTANGLNFDVSPVINREVTKALKAETKNGYQIVVWKKAPPHLWSE